MIFSDLCRGRWFPGFPIAIHLGEFGLPAISHFLARSAGAQLHWERQFSWLSYVGSHVPSQC